MANHVFFTTGDNSTAAVVYTFKDDPLPLAALLRFPGIDVNARDTHGRTALIWASQVLPRICTDCATARVCDALHSPAVAL